jgi:hypothetical protein
MDCLLAVAWSGYPKAGAWDFTPLVWAGLIVFTVWAVRDRLRWWVPLVALGLGLPCSSAAAHFGGLAALVLAVSLSFALVPFVPRSKWR